MRILWITVCLLLGFAFPNLALACSADRILGSWENKKEKEIWTFQPDGQIECKAPENSCEFHEFSRNMFKYLGNKKGGLPVAWEIVDTNLVIYFSNGTEKRSTCKFIAGGRMFKGSDYILKKLH